MAIPVPPAVAVVIVVIARMTMAIAVVLVMAVIVTMAVMMTITVMVGTSPDLLRGNTLQTQHANEQNCRSDPAAMHWPSSFFPSTRTVSKGYENVKVG